MGTYGKLIYKWGFNRYLMGFKMIYPDASGCSRSGKILRYNGFHQWGYLLATKKLTILCI